MLKYQPLSQFVENIPEHQALTLKKIIKDHVFAKVALLAITEKATFYAFYDGPFFGTAAVGIDAHGREMYVEICSTDSGIVHQWDYS